MPAALELVKADCKTVHMYLHDGGVVFFILLNSMELFRFLTIQ